MAEKPAEQQTLASECGFTSNRNPLTVIAAGMVWPSIASGRGASSWGQSRKNHRWCLAMTESEVTPWEDWGGGKARPTWGGGGPDLTGTRAWAWEGGGMSVVQAPMLEGEAVWGREVENHESLGQ